jgi:hypothetical protein
MQRLIFLASIFLLSVSAENCNTKKKNYSEVYKGRLEVQAICMNYTIKLLEGNIDTSKIAGNWTDEITKKTYNNVFALQNPCTFPANLKQGDEFSFVIDTAAAQPDCAVCMAYYPTPGKKLSIKIIEDK